MPTRVISIVRQLHQFIIVFSFKLKTFIGSRAGSLLTIPFTTRQTSEKQSKAAAVCVPFYVQKQ
jgi:hypothetical protein